MPGRISPQDGWVNLFAPAPTHPRVVSVHLSAIGIDDCAKSRRSHKLAFLGSPLKSFVQSLNMQPVGLEQGEKAFTQQRC